jgi:hypothetical protein
MFAANMAFSLVSDGAFALKAFAIATRKALRAAGSRENWIGAARSRKPRNASAVLVVLL